MYECIKVAGHSGAVLGQERGKKSLQTEANSQESARCRALFDFDLRRGIGGAGEGIAPRACIGT